MVLLHDNEVFRTTRVRICNNCRKLDNKVPSIFYDNSKELCSVRVLSGQRYNCKEKSVVQISFAIGVAPNLQLCTCIIKIIAFKECHLMW